MYYGTDKRQDLTHLAFSLIKAAAFHRHDEYILGIVTRYLELLHLDCNGTLLLSASLGGAAALIAFVHCDKEESGLFNDVQNSV